MSYVGQNLPTDVFGGYTTDTFAGDGSATTFTLSQEPISEQGLIVVINNVIQQPTTNYTVSGTTLTIVGTAVASGDVIYARHTGVSLPIGTASVLDKITTIGSGAAEDTKIVFDGNAQDFYIGLDDSADDLIIGLGSTVGTTPIISVDENKDVAIPDGGLTITVDDNSNNLTLTSTDADANSGPNLLLDRNSSSTANQDVIGVITYRGRNDAGQDVDYVQLETRLGDETDGTEDGSFKLRNMMAGTLREYMSTNHAEICFNEDSQDLDFRIESNNYELCFALNGGTDRVGIGNNTSAPSQTLDVRDAQNDAIFSLRNTLTSGNIYGQQIVFGYAPDDNSNHFFYCADTAANRMFIMSDGDLRNHDNSYGSTSDERIKQNIRDANSQWDDIKAVKVRNYKKKDDVRQYGDKAWEQIGVIAQELEAAGMDKLVKESDPTSADIISDASFGTLYEDGDTIPDNKEIGDVKEVKQKVKGIGYSVLYMKAIKALQEAMAKIETLETKVKALEDA